jgi:hypothetical protein
MAKDRDEESAPRGRRPKENRGEVIDRAVSFKVTEREREAIRRRLEQRNSEVDSDARVTESAYIRKVVLADLRAHGCLDVPASAAEQPEAAPAVHAAPPAPPPSPVEPPPAVEPPVSASAEEASAEDAGPFESLLPKPPPTAAVLRRRIEKARADRGMTIKALADASGVSEREVKRLLTSDDPLYPESRRKLQRALDGQGPAR